MNYWLKGFLLVSRDSRNNAGREHIIEIKLKYNWKGKLLMKSSKSLTRVPVSGEDPLSTLPSFCVLFPHSYLRLDGSGMRADCWVTTASFKSYGWLKCQKWTLLSVFRCTRDFFILIHPASRVLSNIPPSSSRHLTASVLPNCLEVTVPVGLALNTNN